MPFHEILGFRFGYQIFGEGDRTPLLLLHGFTGNRKSWSHLMPALSANRPVLAVDLPGHGQTPHTPDPQQMRMEIVSDALARFVSALGLADPKPLDVLGYSMGGRLALFFALHHPNLVRRLVLESASPGLADDQERLARLRSDEALAHRIESDGIAAFVQEWERLPLFASQSHLPPTQRARLRQRRLANHPAGLAASLRGMGTGIQPSLWSLLPKLHCPVLLLAGELDQKFSAINSQMQTLIPGSVLHLIPDAGHTPDLENTAVTLRHILNFLEDPR